MALTWSLNRFVCTGVLVVSLLSVTNRALSVTFEQVCQGLDNVVANANSGVLSPCSRDDNCTMVQCQVTGTTAFFIHQSALTFLPCQNPPSVRLQLWSPAMMVLVDQVFNETRTVAVNTAGGALPVTVTISRATDSEIGIMITYEFQGTQTLIGFTSVPVDTSVCTMGGAVTTTPVETTVSSEVSTTVAAAVDDRTTQDLDSPTSKGRAATLTSGLAVALALTLCLLSATAIF